MAQDFAERARIDQFIGRDTGELVGGDVADRVAAGLNRMHLDRGEFFKNVGRVLDPDPIELDVLPSGEVPVTAVISARDMRQRAHLLRGQHAVRDRNAQHRRVPLHVQAVAQTQRLELVFGQLPA